jgi:HSP20 family protein
MASTVSKWLPAGLAPFERSALSWLSMMQSPVRIEEHIDGKAYLLRAEVPGVDPAKDLTVTYHDGALRLQIRRADTRKAKTYTEFNYGSYDRTVPVSTMIDEESIRASYQDGILEIKAKLSGPEDSHRGIKIEVGVGSRVSPAAKR